MAENSLSLIDLKALSEPANKLIDAAASAVGILYEPTRIRRKARAEADVAAILARGDEEVQEINLRAAERLANNELRRQKNIESIVVQAVEALPDQVSDEPVDEDWVAQFFSYSQDVSNKQMQDVWAKILAGEFTKPNSFSPRTLHIVRHLRQNEATDFRVFCSHVFDSQYLIRSDATDAYIASLGLNTMTLKNLENVGLINTGLSFNSKIFGDGMSLQYFGQSYSMTLNESEDKDDPLSSFSRMLNIYTLTLEGRELAFVTGAEANTEYIKQLQSSLSQKGYLFELRS